MTNKTQTMLLSTFFIFTLIGIHQYVEHNTNLNLCKGAEYNVKNGVLYCWSGNDWVKPERLK